MAAENFPDADQFDAELIRRAEDGDPEAGKEILVSVALRIDQGKFDSSLFPYLANCLWDYSIENIPLSRALNVEKESPVGGRPVSYDRTMLAATDIILRHHCHMKPEAAIAWIEEHIGVGRRSIQRLRIQYDGSYSEDPRDQRTEILPLKVLLEMTGNMRQNLKEVLPQ